jgi:hypothetical protein
MNLPNYNLIKIKALFDKGEKQVPQIYLKVIIT